MAGGVSIYDVLGDIADFDEGFTAGTTPEARKVKIMQHLQDMCKLGYKVPDFEKGLDWLNVKEPLSMVDNLQGQIVVLDFFTYCCVNCMHILPDLEEVEEKFPPGSGVVVLGVHSAKFLNEKLTANIRSAVLRYGINHPVVNDKDATLWNTLAVSCWPTLLFVGPKGDLLYSIAGEGHRAKILEFLETAIEFFQSKDELQPCQLPMNMEVNKQQKSDLSFPGKISIWEDKKMLLISDSGNHRIIVADFDGIVQAVIGSGQRGLKDGSWSEAQFSSPQGVAGCGNSIYVADTDNHCLREISWVDRTVNTIAGTGQQGTDTEGGGLGTSQELSSPWDVVVGEGDSPLLYLAMSGTHQIWVYFLCDSQCLKNRFHPKSTCLRLAGSGKEENRNNSYPEKASFAQPSGLVYRSSESQGTLYVADSESSSVRAVSLLGGKVTGIVGGEKDPTNLFAYGDVPGKGTMAKLQHPLGVALLGQEGPLLVADSYNHKIKTVDLATNQCDTLAGSGQAGDMLSQTDVTDSEFNEPGGLCVNTDLQLVYVADTNNHAIKVLDLKGQRVFELPIVLSQDTVDSPVVQEAPPNAVILPTVLCSVCDKHVDLSILVPLSPAEHINDEGPHKWKISALDDEGKQFLDSLHPLDCKGNLLFSNDLKTTKTQAYLTMTLPSSLKIGSIFLLIDMQVFVCAGEVCLPPRNLQFRQQLVVSSVS